eukprot:gb/GECG01001677.1/.p1 GENE.gb/GECG01001677.1/~~gb/GECG01001677.1/.p1  ORF type:complete len:550 (+),score=67.04 gb/GECG01001677.1/:1-1650(+)
MNSQSQRSSAATESTNGAPASNDGTIASGDAQLQHGNESPTRASSFDSALPKSLVSPARPGKPSGKPYRHSVHVESSPMHRTRTENHSSEGPSRPHRHSEYYYYGGGFPIVGIGSLASNQSSSPGYKYHHTRRHSTTGAHTPTRRSHLPSLETTMASDKSFSQESPKGSPGPTGSPSRRPLLDIVEQGQDEGSSTATANPNGSLSAQLATSFLDKQVNHLTDLLKTLAQYVDTNYSSITQLKTAIGELAAQVQNFQQHPSTTTDGNITHLEQRMSQMMEAHRDFERRVESRMERLHTQVQVQSEGYESLMSAVEEINHSVETFADAMEAMTSEDASRETLVSNMNSELTKLRSMVRGSDSTEGLRDSLRRIRSFSGPQQRQVAGFEQQGYNAEQSAKIKYLEERIAALERRLPNEDSLPASQSLNTGSNTLTSDLDNLASVTITEHPESETGSTDSDHSSSPHTAQSGTAGTPTEATAEEVTHLTPQPPSQRRSRPGNGAVTPNYPGRGRIIREPGSQCATSPNDTHTPIMTTTAVGPATTYPEKTVHG